MTAPTNELRFSNEHFARIAGELYRRSGYGRTESGCFVLGTQSGALRVARDVVFFDDVDPGAYRTGAIHFDTTRLSAVYNLCEEKGLSIVGDIHVHPKTAFLSPIDSAHPVVALEGHASIILPYNGRYRDASQIAVNIYTKAGNWTEIPRASVKDFLVFDDLQIDDKAFDRVELMLLNRNMERHERSGLLDSIRVAIISDELSCRTASGQAALLTSVALCRRFARGGVAVVLKQDAHLKAMPGTRLSEELHRLGAQPLNGREQIAIMIGKDRAPSGVFAARVFGNDGVYGCVPAAVDAQLDDSYVPGAIAAASLATAELFRQSVLERVEVSPRERRLRLWYPGELDHLPPRWTGLVPALWILGFGHLGNAYAWTIALSPAFRPHLYVQDPQSLEIANCSTQLFAVAADIGRLKVDLAQRELARFGLTVTPDPRGIDDAYQPQNAPAVLLAGLDHAAPRRAISRTNATLIIDAGLGDTETTFSQFAVHAFDDRRLALELFEDKESSGPLDHRAESHAYQQLDDGTAKTRCALLSLATTSVAVPFVGACVSAIAVTTLLKRSLGLKPAELISGDVLGWLPG